MSRPDPAPDQSSTGVHRLGDAVVNFYLVRDTQGVTLVDAGLPAFWPRMLRTLADIGVRLTDIRAVLITHGHQDHIGLAERLRAEAGARVIVHEHDAPILADPRHTTRHWKPERSLLPYALRRPAALRGPLHLIRHGALRTPAVRQLETFAGQTTLDVPGRPVALPVPGHTAGSTAFLFPDHNVLFTGDALVTADTVTGHVGPCLIGPAFTQDSAAAVDALDVLAATGADTVLTGHGEPWPHGVAAAAEQARKRVHRTGP